MEGKHEAYVSNQPKRQLFRQEAIRYYLQDRHKTVLPKLVTRQGRKVLWLLLGILLLINLFIGFHVFKLMQ